jgi:hypothetical protein
MEQHMAIGAHSARTLLELRSLPTNIRNSRKFALGAKENRFDLELTKHDFDLKNTS